MIHWVLIFVVVDGRKALLPEFSFKRPSRRSDVGVRTSFTGTSLLNKAHQSPLKTTNRGGMRLAEVMEPHKISTTRHRAPKQTNRLPESKVPTQSMQRAQPILLQEHGFSRKDQETNVAGHMSSPKGKWENKMKFDRLSEGEVSSKYDKSEKFPPRSVHFQENSAWQTSPHSTVSVTMVTEKSVGSPRPYKDIPYCSWIDPSDCQDISKVKSECVESPTIPALEGKCKMCPFNWCTGPNDMTESGKLLEQSPLDIVINEGGNVQSPKFGHAINPPFSGQGQNSWRLKSVNDPRSVTTTEIPFWNFQTFGP